MDNIFQTLVERGWDPVAYLNACKQYDGDFTDISLTHPLNWITEKEAEKPNFESAVMREIENKGFHISVTEKDQ